MRKFIDTSWRLVTSVSEKGGPKSASSAERERRAASQVVGMRFRWMVDLPAFLLMAVLVVLVLLGLGMRGGW
jgi:hypothetical protein